MSLFNTHNQSNTNMIRDPSVDMNRKPAERKPGAPVYPNDGMYGGGGVQYGGPGGQVGAGMQTGAAFSS